MWVRSLGQEDLLVKEIANHSSILAWRFSWTEELGGDSPWGCKKLNMTGRLSAHTHTHTDSMPPMSALECGFSALELTEVMDNRDFQKIIYLGC